MFYDLKKIIGRIVLVLALALAFPAVAIVATWNTLPGETLYPLKRNLEKIASLIASPSYTASSELEIKLISRRLDETEKTIDKSSSAGLKELVSQAQSARKTVLGTNNIKAQSQNSAQLVAELRIAQTKLQEKKVAINTYQPGNYQANPQKTVTNVVNITNIVYKQKEIDSNQGYQEGQNTDSDPSGQDTELDQQSPEEIVEEIEQAEQEIVDIINDLETNINTTGSGSSIQSLDTPYQTPPQTDMPGRGQTERERGGTSAQSVEPPAQPTITPEPVIAPEPSLAPELTPDTQNL